jgi:hypothetical protein
LHPMAPRQEIPYALVNVIVDRPVSQQPGSVAEVRRPPSQSLIESIAYLFPVPDIARLQQIAHLLLNSLHTLLRRTCSQIPVTIFPLTLRAERISEKVKPLCPSFPDFRLRFVQSKANPSHDIPRPFQCLCRMSATEDHEIIRVIHHSGLKHFTPSGDPPVLHSGSCTGSRAWGWQPHLAECRRCCSFRPSCAGSRSRPALQSGLSATS